MKGKIDINSVTKTVTPVGNSAHVMVPKSWIGRVVHVIPKDIFDEEMLGELLKGHRFGVRRRHKK